MPPRHSIGLNATPRHGPPSSAGSNGGATPRGTPAQRATSPGGARRPPPPPPAAARVPNVTQRNIATKLAQTANPVEKASILASLRRPVDTVGAGRSSYIDADPIARRYAAKELSDPSSSLTLWEHLSRRTPSLRAVDIFVPFDIQRPVEGPGSFVRRVDPRSLELQRSTVALPGAFNPRPANDELPVNRLRRAPSPVTDRPVRPTGRARSTTPDMKAILEQPWRRTVGAYEGTVPTTRRHTLPPKSDHCFSSGVMQPDPASEVRGRARGRSPTVIDETRAGLPSRYRRPQRSHSADSAARLVNDPFAVPGDIGYTEPPSLPRGRRGVAEIAAHFERQPENVIARPNPALEAKRERWAASKPKDHNIFNKPLAQVPDPNSRRSSSASTTPYGRNDHKEMLHWSDDKGAAPAAGQGSATRAPAARRSPSRTYEDAGARGGMAMPQDRSNDDAASPSRYRRLNDPSGMVGFSQRANAQPSPGRRAAAPQPSATANLFAFGRGVLTPPAPAATGAAPPMPPSRPATTRSQSPTHRSSGVQGVFSWV